MFPAKKTGEEGERPEFMKEKCYPCSKCDEIFYVEDNLLKHAKKHSDEKKNCIYCNKIIERAANLKLHQKTCDRNVNRKWRVMLGVDGDVVDTGFNMVQSAFKKLIVVYRKPLNTCELKNVKLAFTQDMSYILRREVMERKGMKWHSSLKVKLCKALNPSVETDPPAVFNTDAVWGLIGSNYEDDMNAAFDNVMRQLDEYQCNGSGWVLSEFVELDVTIITCTPWKNRKVAEDDEDDEDDEYDPNDDDYVL